MKASRTINQRRAEQRVQASVNAAFVQASSNAAAAEESLDTVATGGVLVGGTPLGDKLSALDARISELEAL